jgi:hypothetical protein
MSTSRPKFRVARTFASAAPPAQSEALSPIASLRQVMSAVLWGFFGVRKCKAMARDIMTIKPAELIVVGIVFAASFVFILLLVVHLITRGL